MSDVNSIPRPKEIHSRFLYPFFFRRNAARAACEELLRARIATREGKSATIWECAAPPGLYKEEVLDHVDGFLFQETERGCRYLRLSGVAASKWFNKLRAVLSEREPTKTAASGKAGAVTEKHAAGYAVHLVGLASVEIFLSNYGVGVLSLALTPNIENLGSESAALFNYKFSQLRPQVAASLRTDHPSDNEAIWNQMPLQQREKIAPPPNPNSPLSERLGFAGGSFTLSELINQVLLAPLNQLELSPVQNQLSVYTVARFGEEVDLEKAETQTALAAFLSGISQVEEPVHAGAPAGIVNVNNAILNRRHWAAVGLLGMAHIVSDQPEPGASFNEQRVPRVLLKYFVPYLVALLQRTSLHRAISEASRLILSREDNKMASFTALQRYVLEFALDGNFPEVSNREVIHRYYLMARNGLGVPSAFENARRAISDMDAQFTLDRRVKIAETTAQTLAATIALQTEMAAHLDATRGLQEQMTEHLDVVAKVQRTVEVIEIFVVSVYLAHLWDMFATHIESLHGWISYGIIIAAVVGILSMTAYLRPWQHRKKKPKSNRV